MIRQMKHALCVLLSLCLATVAGAGTWSAPTGKIGAYASGFPAGFTVAYPATDPGDAMVVKFACREELDVVTLPSTWNWGVQHAGGNTGWFYKEAVGDETGTLSVTWGGGGPGRCAMQMAAFPNDGELGWGTLTIASVSTTFSAQVDIPTTALTVSNPDTLILAGGLSRTVDLAPIIAMPTGIIEIGQTSFGSNATVVWGYEIQAGAGMNKAADKFDSASASTAIPRSFVSSIVAPASASSLLLRRRRG